MTYQSTPAPASAAHTPVAQGPVVAGSPAPSAPVSGSPEQIYRGLREKREVLRDQKDQLENERQSIKQELRATPSGAADRSGLEQRLAQVDQAIVKVSIDIAETDAQVAQAASIPGAKVEEPPQNAWEFGPPVELIAMGMVLTAALLFPVMLARARRLWRSANVISAVPPDLVDKISAMERGIDSIAVEVERIGEGQRFVTQLLAERADAARVTLPRNDRE